MATQERPTAAEDAVAYARERLRAGSAGEAEATLRAALRQQPADADAVELLAVCLARRGAFGEALPLFDAVVRARPGSAGARNNLGNALAGSARHAEALACFDAAIALDPRAAVLHANRGNALKALGRLDEAIASYAAAIALAPDHAGHRYNRGTALLELRRPNDALADLDRAVRLDPRHAPSWLNRGSARFELRRFEAALADFDRALAIDPANARAHGSRANALRELGRSGEALASCDRALALSPELAEAHAARGNALHDLRRFDEALASFDRALAAKPSLAPAHSERARVLRELGRQDEALAGFAAALAADPALPYALGDWLQQKLACCDWEGLPDALARVADGVGRGARACTPFTLLALPGPLARQQACARAFVADRAPAGPGSAWAATPLAGGRLNVGYFSADFHDHATAHLLAGVLERHDRTRFEITAFSFGPRSGDAWQRRVEAAVDRFVEVGGFSDDAIVARARELRIDIAVDLKGHTRHARTGIFARRAAPLQVSWLGYPGTLGAPYVDYVLADPTLVPPADRVWYDERIACLPHSYQPNDSTKAIDPDAPSREAAGLPAGAFVFCCFNHAWKILPDVFGAWMRLLHAVDGSVLWLLDAGAAAVRNLRREAAARGVAPERLVFAPRVALAAHLARHRLADLFLDTTPYNAHTTASDALWAGVPVVTCLGETFASRVAASLLRAVGLPGLVAPDLPGYESLALALATDPARLAAVRAELAANRRTRPLFDTAGFARDLEALYAAMADRQRSGLPPDHLGPLPGGSAP